MGSALFFLSVFLFCAPTHVLGSALGNLKTAAGRSAAFVEAPAVSGAPIGEDRTDTGGTWMLHCDCSSCPRSWYPDPHPTKGPYATESACLQDLNEAKYRPGASSCESYYCQPSGGAAGGSSASGGATGVKNGVDAALRASEAAAARNSGDRGADLLAPEPAGSDNGARYGIGRRSKPKPDHGGLGSTVALLRKPEEGGPFSGKPYVNCATWARDAANYRAGLQKQAETIAKSRKMLADAERDAAQAGEKGQARAKEFAWGAVTDVGLEIAKKAHLMEKGVDQLLEKADMTRDERALGIQLSRQLAQTHARAQKLAEGAKLGDKFIDAGGTRAWMRSSLQGLQKSYQAAMADPALREEILNFAGENIAEAGGPAMAFGYKTVKADIDLTALALSKGLDEDQAAEQRQNLQTLQGQLDRINERIKFLEQEGESQCKKP